MQLAILRAMNETASTAGVWRKRNLKLPTLNVDSLDTPFSTTFEEAAERLQQLPGMYFEPDGSFLWTGWQAEWFWRLEGNLYDRKNALQFVELRIDCPLEPFEQVVAALAPNDSRLYELPGEGVFIREESLKALVFPH